MPKEKIDYKQKARERAAQLGKSGWYKLEAGSNMFRILPTPESKKTQGLWFEYNLHRNIGPGKKTVTCGKDIEGNGNCWLCDKEIPRLQKKGSARADLLAAKQTFVVQVAKVTGEEGNYKYQGPLLFSPSAKVAANILQTVFGSKKRDYTSPTKGYNISLSRTGTGFKDTRYGILEADEEKSVIPEELVAKLKPFSDLKELTPYDESKMKAAYQGVDANDDDDDEDEEEDDDETEEEDDEDDAPKKKKSKPAPVKAGKKKPADDDDDEEDDDEDEEDDEEEEVEAKKKGKTVPAKKGKPAPAPSDDDEDDDDEDDDDDDEEEDEKPAKKKVAGGKSKKKPTPSDDDEEEDDDEDDDQEEAPKSSSKKKPAPSEDEEDDDDEDDEEDDDEEDDAPVKPPAKGLRKGKKK